MMKKDKAKNTIVCNTNPNAVGQPLFATPGIKSFINRKVTGLATKKKMSAE